MAMEATVFEAWNLRPESISRIKVMDDESLLLSKS